MKLTDSKIKRGGSTSNYGMSLETTNIVFDVGSRRGASFNFSITSAGGGITNIGVEIGDKDLPLILADILMNRPDLAPTFVRLAAKAIELETERLDMHKVSMVWQLDELTTSFETKFGDKEISESESKEMVRRMLTTVKKIFLEKTKLRLR
jgi:hypothetical protein